MKKRKWLVKTEKNNYEIKLVPNSLIIVDGKKYSLDKLKTKSMLNFITEYKVPIKDEKILLSYYINKYILVVDGKDYDTGKDYVSISDIPKITYVFMLLNSFNLFNGVVGVCLAFLGVFLTLKVSCLNVNVFIKFWLNVLILIGMFMLLLIVVVLLNLLLYR